MVVKLAPHGYCIQCSSLLSNHSPLTSAFETHIMIMLQLLIICFSYFQTIGTQFLKLSISVPSHLQSASTPSHTLVIMGLSVIHSFSNRIVFWGAIFIRYAILESLWQIRFFCSFFSSSCSPKERGNFNVPHNFAEIFKCKLNLTDTLALHPSFYFHFILFLCSFLTISLAW